MKAAELLLALLALAVAVAAVAASGWDVLVWTSLLAAPYLMLVLASRQLQWWREARVLFAGAGLLVSIVVATVELRAIAQDTVESGQAVMTAWMVHAAFAIAAMIGASVLTIRRVREVRRDRSRQL